MALRKITSIRCFANDPDKKATHSNSNWKPYVGKEPCDVVLSKDTRHQISVFANEDGSIDVSISERIADDYQGGDSVSANVRQGGLRKIADSIEAPKARIALDDDDVPF
tara:strand:+ start:379 stop:705 length:327 start_codon:yes stop_codon:yes gene_type:complete